MYCDCKTVVVIVAAPVVVVGVVIAAVIMAVFVAIIVDVILDMISVRKSRQFASTAASSNLKLLC